MSQDNQMRPKNIDSFIGQTETIAKLKVILESAKIRNTIPGHLLFYGPAGLGKTSLARIIAEETGLPLQTIVGTQLEKQSDVIDVLSSMKRSQVLFIDEIHGVAKQAEEMLYDAMEDGVIHIAVGNGASTEYVTIAVPEFVLVGGTTEVGLITKPLFDRFTAEFPLRPYTDDEIGQIIKKNSVTLNLNLTDDAIVSIASRSNGTPRIANNLLKQVRDKAVTMGKTEVDKKLVEDAMGLFGIDEYGLNASARNVLVTLRDTFNGGPVGGARLATASNEKIQTLENTIEPLLLKFGLISMTPKGRVLTSKGESHVG